MISVNLVQIQKNVHNVEELAEGQIITLAQDKVLQKNVVFVEEVEDVHIVNNYHPHIHHKRRCSMRGVAWCVIKRIVQV